MDIDISRQELETTTNRSDIRHGIQLKVEVETSESFDTQTVNLSENGICFEIPRQLPVGREINLWVHLPFAQMFKPVRSRCRIVWHDEGDQGIRHGGTFLFFCADGYERLQSYLGDIQ